jgi:hypothetical protein
MISHVTLDVNRTIGPNYTLPDGPNYTTGYKDTDVELQYEDFTTRIQGSHTTGVL